METIIFGHLQLWRSELYMLIFLGLLLEGEAVLFAAFYLVSQHKLDLFDTLGFVISGVMIGDTLWFHGGRLTMKIPILSWVMNRVPKEIDKFIKQRPAFSIIITKFLYGFHRPTLLRLYTAGVNYRTFLKADIPGALLWITIVGILGYFFSDSSNLLKTHIKYIEIGLAGSLIVFVLISKLISNLFLKGLLRKSSQ